MFTSFLKNIASYIYTPNTPQPPKEQEGSPSLPVPVEIFQKILFNLNREDSQKAVCVNSLWQKNVIYSSKSKNLSSIREYIQMFIENLEGNAKDQLKELFLEERRNGPIVDSKTLQRYNLKQKFIDETLTTNNLIELDQKLSESKDVFIDGFINILKDLSEEDFNKIEKLFNDSLKDKSLDKSFYLKDIIELAKIYRKVDQIKDQVNNTDILSELGSKLATMGYIKRAIQISNFSNYMTPDHVLRSITVELIKNNQLKKLCR